MPITIEIFTAEEVNLNNQVVTPSRLLAKLELHLPDNKTLDQNTVQDIRGQLLNIASTYTLGPGEVTQ